MIKSKPKEFFTPAGWEELQRLHADWKERDDAFFLRPLRERSTEELRVLFAEGNVLRQRMQAMLADKKAQDVEKDVLKAIERELEGIVIEIESVMPEVDAGLRRALGK